MRSAAAGVRPRRPAGRDRPVGLPGGRRDHLGRAEVAGRRRSNSRNAQLISNSKFKTTFEENCSWKRFPLKRSVFSISALRARAFVPVDFRCAQNFRNMVPNFETW